MINDYLAGGWSVEPVNIILDKDKFASIREFVDIAKTHAIYIMLSEEDRIKLLSGDGDDIKIYQLQQTVAPLWNSKGVYSQGKNSSKPNYDIVAYKAQVGTFKRVFNVEYLKQSDAALLLDPKHVYTDGKLRPYIKKLCVVHTANNNFVITTHQIVRDYAENAEADTKLDEIPKFTPFILNTDNKFLKYFSWSCPVGYTKLMEDIKNALPYIDKYDSSIIIDDTDFPEEATNNTTGLDRISEITINRNLVKIGYIISTEIPVLIAKTCIDKNMES